VQQWISDADPEDVVDLVPVNGIPAGWMPVLRAVDTNGDDVAVVHADLPALATLAGFDAVVNNADRKGSHVLPTQDGRILGVDHGLCFHTDDKLRTILWGWAGRPLPDDVIDGIARLTSALEAELGERLDSLITITEMTALSTSRAASAAGSGAAPGAASGSGAPAACGSTQSDARAGVAPVDAGSADGTAVIAVQPRADVTLGIERVVAERAGRPAGGHNLLGVLGEVACLAEREEDPQRVGAVLAVLQDDFLADLLLGQGQQFHDDLRTLAVPGQAHGADLELGVNRGGQRQFGGRDRGGFRVGLGAESAGHLGDQRAEPVRQDGDLLFLALDGQHPPTVHHLQKEFAFARLPDRSCEESVG
jgi:hypothetical protein